MTTNQTRFERTGPVGLGGWLWPVTWFAATLPLLLTAVILPALADDIVFLLRHREIPYPLDESWVQREIAVSLLLSAIAWWWAVRWFARDARMPRRAPVVLLAAAVLVTLAAGFDPNRSAYIALASVLLAMAAASFLAARFSKRVRNTFVSDALPLPAPGWRGTLFRGPLDWSHRRWLLPGALAFAVLRLWLDFPVFAEAAFETIPPPPAPARISSGTGNAAALSQLGHPGRYIEASRMALMLSAAGALLLAGALIGLARGARWTPWLGCAALLFAMAAPLRMSLRDWCCPFLDGPDFDRMWRAWLIVLLIATVGGAFRRWPDMPPDRANHQR